jgi:hypothetical protein
MSIMTVLQTDSVSLGDVRPCIRYDRVRRLLEMSPKGNLVRHGS